MLILSIHMTIITYYWEILLLLIPVFTAIWATIVKLKAKHLIQALLIIVFIIIFSIDGLATCYQLHEDTLQVPEWLNVAALYSGALLLPLAFLYFAVQVRSGWKNWAIYTVLASVIIVSMTNIVFFIGSSSVIPDEAAGKLHMFHIIRDGAIIFSCKISVIMILFQALLISTRIISFIFFMHSMELTFSKDMQRFFLLAFMCVAFAVLTYVIPWPFWISHKYLYVGGLVILVGLQFGHIARNKDLAPLVTKEDAEPVDLHEYIKKNSDLAARARQILDVEKRYLLPGLVIDDLVNELGTNRTYFTRMMRIEFGQSFNEYVNNCRLQHSQDLLINSDKSIADIAIESGFGSSSTYCRVFKRLTDTTPESWREMHKK